MASATGSVWNLNNWHWEEKSYSKWACDELTKQLQSSKFPDDVKLHSINVSGDASVSVRKGKQIVAVEINVRADWVQGESTGTLIINGVDTDSCQDGDFEIRVEANADTEPFRTSKDLIRKGGTAVVIRNIFKDFVLCLSKTANDNAAAALDAQRRKEEAAKMHEAREVTGTAQQELLKDIKAKDDEKWTEAKAGDVTQAVGDAKGSVWNVHSYHWEEIKLTKFAIGRLEALFGSSVPAFTLGIKSGERPVYPCQVSLINPKVTGEVRLASYGMYACYGNVVASVHA
eukprot:Lankesteria_metandrocarpae@DN4889_c0_g1_i4.p1